MHIFSNRIKLLGLFVALFSVSACTSGTMIRTTDSKAKIYINGEYKGKGEAYYSDSKIVGSKNSVRIQREGCEPKNFSFARNEEFNVGACIGGVFVLVPFLWIMDYKGDRTYEYTCEPLK